METKSTQQTSRHKPLDLSESGFNKTMLGLAVPAILENFMGTAVFLGNALIVGWLKDEKALAGVMLAGSMLMLLGAPFQALGVATNALVARCWGEQDYDKAKRFARQTLFLGWLISIVITITGFVFARSMMQWLGAKPAVVEMGASFIRIVILAYPLEVPLFMAGGILRGAGDTRTPMFINVLMNVINIILNIIFAYGWGPIPAMGLIGVAWGAMISQALGGLMALIVLVFGLSRIKISFQELFFWNKPMFQQLWNLSYPVMIERLLTNGAGMIFMKIIALLGTTALAAHNIALRIESIAYMPPWGVSIAVSTIVGQSLGAGKPEVAEKAVKKGLFWIGSFMFFLGIMFVLFSKQFVVLFGATPEVIHMAGVVLQISALELPFIAFFAILAGCMRGAGDTKSPLYVMFICLPIFRFGVVYLFAITFGWGLPGVWLATACDWMARVLGLWLLFRRGRWKQVTLKGWNRMA